MASSQRPRPRARKIASSATIISSTDSQSPTLHSTLSPPVESARVSFNGHDDDFFTRKRIVPIKGRTESAPQLDIGVDGNINDDDDDDDVNDSVGSSSDGEGRRRKRVRRHKSSWAKSSSLNKMDSMDIGKTRQVNSSQDDDIDLLHDSVLNRRKASRSPSLTPPPALDKHLIEKLKTVLEQYTVPKSIDLLEEDESYSVDAGGAVELDPDLVRMIRGDRAKEQRKQAKEREAQSRLDEEKIKRTQSTQKTTALPKVDAIEVVDSDEDQPRKLSSRIVGRNRDSSSPVEMVSFSQKTRQELQTKPVLPLKKPVIPVVEEEERLSIVMKGGEGGTLQANVRVKATTHIKKLLDHFKEAHKDAIPKAKLKSVRIRFDGDWLNPATTVGDAGIEDEEQIDVVW